MDFTEISDFFNKNVLIIILLIILILVFLGINVLNISGNLLETVASIFGPAVYGFLELLGYSTGTLINTSSEIISSSAKTGIDIGDGVAHNIGNILKNDVHPISNDNYRNIDDAINIQKKHGDNKSEPISSLEGSSWSTISDNSMPITNWTSTIIPNTNSTIAKTTPKITSQLFQTNK
jgi:hypothetical protein